MTRNFQVNVVMSRDVRYTVPTIFVSLYVQFFLRVLSTVMCPIKFARKYTLPRCRRFAQVVDAYLTRCLHADLGSSVTPQHANSGYCGNFSNAFKHSLFGFQFQYSPLTFPVLVFSTKFEDRDVAVTRTAHKERGRTSGTSCLALHETVLHWDVAEYRRFYTNLYDARNFAALFSGGRNFTMLDRLGIRHDTVIGACIRKRTTAGQWCASIKIPISCCTCHSFGTLTKRATFTLCVRCCIKQKATRARCENTNWSVG